MRRVVVFFFFIIGAVVVTNGQELMNNTLLLEYYQAQRYADAAQYLKQFYREDKPDTKLLGNLAYCYRMAGDYPEAERFYGILLREDSTDTKTLLNLAAIQTQRGLSQQAMTYYKKVLAVDSGHLASYKALADLSFTEGELDVSRSYLIKANQLNPLEPDVAYDLADLSIQMKQYRFADSIVNLALVGDQQNVLLLRLRAQAKYGMQDYKAAIAVGDSLRAMGDESDLLLTTLAPAYYFEKQYNKCIDVLTLMKAKGRELKEGQLYYMAMSYKKLKKMKEAVDYFEQTIKSAVSPNVANYYFEKGDSYEQLNQNRTAIAAYQKSLQFAVFPMAYYSLALIYDHKIKNPKQAIRYYKLYLSQNPSKKNEGTYITYVKQRIVELEGP